MGPDALSLAMCYTEAVAKRVSYLDASRKPLDEAFGTCIDEHTKFQGIKIFAPTSSQPDKT
jgi:hypothetical protein